ncbi:hypothetical protein AZ78_3217 [Lysobacter capsici AZ78]|uniref:Uncharacterized protein n=1 Tax=Lysobacter capsici AZ78 TaxID=1444315 RepID=A0A108UAQ8_9GAMM|nr:hypothetical protein AZ78_3217 [Lysobacter capsici AZ78]
MRAQYWNRRARAPGPLRRTVACQWPGCLEKTRCAMHIRLPASGRRLARPRSMAVVIWRPGATRASARRTPTEDDRCLSKPAGSFCSATAIRAGSCTRLVSPTLSWRRAWIFCRMRSAAPRRGGCSPWASFRPRGRSRSNFCIPWSGTRSSLSKSWSNDWASIPSPSRSMPPTPREPARSAPPSPRSRYRRKHGGRYRYRWNFEPRLKALNVADNAAVRVDNDGASGRAAASSDRLRPRMLAR